MTAPASRSRRTCHGVLARHASRQREAATRRRHVARLEVVFEQHRDAVERARAFPSRRSASSAAAAASACGLSASTAFNRGPAWSSAAIRWR
jgi:hypothetical protein